MYFKEDKLVDFKGKDGKSIEIITKKIKKELKVDRPKIGKRKRTLKNRIKEGKLSTSDWNYILSGINGIRKILEDKVDRNIAQKVVSGKDVDKAQKAIIEYRNLIQEAGFRIQDKARLQKSLHEQADSLYDYADILQAARDGIIMKVEERTDIIEDKEVKSKYDTTMTPAEVVRILRDYEVKINRIYGDKLVDYLGIGLSVAGIIGSISKGKNSDENRDFKYITISILGKLAAEAINKIIKEKSRYEERLEKSMDLEEKIWQTRRDLLNNERISENETEMVIEEVEGLIKGRIKNENQISDINFVMKTTQEIIQALIVGTYISKSVKINENGKLDGQSLTTALISMKSNDIIISRVNSLYSKAMDNKERYKDFDKLCEQAENIISQMEEKVYPLKGAEEPFDAFEVKDVDAKFYPKKDYDTGKIGFSINIKIPEFSMKRGDTVLLSGASGAGKSTFLRMLKRGDINNRDIIKLDNGQKVDNLGTEFISFRPSMELGNESTVLNQITGKRSVSELNKNEKEKLYQILQELHLNYPNLLEEMSKRKFMEFSTGQQRRLILSKLFYRIDDGASVIIVDEPVGNVEDKLIKEQLEMIKRYAMRKNVMLLLTTHRLDLAESLVTKRYHINENGVMEQLKVEKQIEERN